MEHLAVAIYGQFGYGVSSDEREALALRRRTRKWMFSPSLKKTVLKTHQHWSGIAAPKQGSPDVVNFSPERQDLLLAVTGDRGMQETDEYPASHEPANLHASDVRSVIR